MQPICLYLRAAQPLRFRNYLFSHIGVRHDYEDREWLAEELNILCDQAILPANELLTKWLAQEPSNPNGLRQPIKLAISVGHRLLLRLVEARPDVVASLAGLLATGRVELVADPEFGPLALACAPEQLATHIDACLHQLVAAFGYTPISGSMVGNLLTPDLARALAKSGFRTVLAQLPSGAHHAMPAVAFSSDLALVYGNDEWAKVFVEHFDDPTSSLYPFTAAKFLRQHTPPANLFFDYATFGVTYPEDSGIFGFLEQLVEGIGQSAHFQATLPAELEAVKTPSASGHPAALALADKEFNTLTENKLQKEVLEKLRSLKCQLPIDEPVLMESWLQLCDVSLFRAMRLGQAHPSQRENPYDVYINCMNILSDLEKRLPPPSGQVRTKVFSSL
jgi:hypothetical protein